MDNNDKDDIRIPTFMLHRKDSGNGLTPDQKLIEEENKRKRLLAETKEINDDNLKGIKSLKAAGSPENNSDDVKAKSNKPNKTPYEKKKKFNASKAKFAAAVVAVGTILGGLTIVAPKVIEAAIETMEENKVESVIDNSTGSLRIEDYTHRTQDGTNYWYDTDAIARDVSKSQDPLIAFSSISHDIFNNRDLSTSLKVSNVDAILTSKDLVEGVLKDFDGEVIDANRLDIYLLKMGVNLVQDENRNVLYNESMKLYFEEIANYITSVIEKGNAK